MKPIKLTSVLNSDRIFLDVEATDRFTLIREVATRLSSSPEVLNASLLAEDAIAREEELSTGIDRGIAMPHARSSAVNTLTCAFVRPASPVDFGSADGRACDLIFFSAVPRACVDQYLHFTAAVVRKLHSPQVVEGLRTAATPDAVLKVLQLTA